MDLNEVRMFVHVVRAHSFAEAARRLGIPANTLSRRIRKLEAGVATRLLQRSTRKLSLTAAGEAFFARCAPAVDEISRAGQDQSVSSQTPSGLVRIAAPAGFLDLFRLDWVVEFLAAQPRVRLDFVLDDARTDLVGEGIDVAFRAGPLKDAQAAILRPIVAQDFGLYASPAYLAARGMPADLRDLANHDCLTASSHLGRVTWTLLGPSGREDVSVSGRFRANNVQVLLQAALAGLGIVLLPIVLIVPDLRAGRLVKVLPQYRREGADLNVVVPSREQIPLAVSAFVEFAHSKFRAIHEVI